MPFWAWAGTATQSNAGGGNIIIDVTAGQGNGLQILAARGLTATAAGKSITFLMVDEDNNLVGNLAAPGAGTAVNVTAPRVLTDVDSTTSSTFMSSLSPRITLRGSDLKLAWSLAAAAQNDTLQVFIWAWVDAGPGVISVARSGGTVDAPTVTVNEVY